MVRAMGWRALSTSSPRPARAGRGELPSITCAAKGGLITEHVSWRWIFYLNVPFGVLCLIGTLQVSDNPDRRDRQHLDLAGAALFALVLAGPCPRPRSASVR